MSTKSKIIELVAITAFAEDISAGIPKIETETLLDRKRLFVEFPHPYEEQFSEIVSSTAVAVTSSGSVSMMAPSPYQYGVRRSLAQPFLGATKGFIEFL